MAVGASWLLVVTVVSVAVGLLLIAVGTGVAFYCLYRRRTSKLRRMEPSLVESVSVSSSYLSDRALKADTGHSLAGSEASPDIRYRQQAIDNGYFTFPATRMHHNGHWSIQHGRHAHPGRYKRNEPARSRVVANSALGRQRRRTRRDVGLLITRSGARPRAYTQSLDRAQLHLVSVGSQSAFSVPVLAPDNNYQTLPADLVTGGKTPTPTTEGASVINAGSTLTSADNGSVLW